MRLLKKLAAYLKIAGKGRKNRTDLVRYLWRRPAIMLAIGAYETATFVSGRVDSKLKLLAQIKVASMVGCPF